MPWDWFFSTLKGLFDPKSFLFVHVGQHQADVGGQKIIHLVTKGCFTQKLGSSDQVSDGHMEICVATRPVGYPSKGVRDQDILKKNQKLNNKKVD